MECSQPVYPLDIVRTMRDQRAMMIQTPVSSAHPLLSCHIPTQSSIGSLSLWGGWILHCANDEMLNKQIKNHLKWHFHSHLKCIYTYNVKKGCCSRGSSCLCWDSQSLRRWCSYDFNMICCALMRPVRPEAADHETTLIRQQEEERADAQWKHLCTTCPLCSFSLVVLLRRHYFYRSYTTF